MRMQDERRKGPGVGVLLELSVGVTTNGPELAQESLVMAPESQARIKGGRPLAVSFADFEETES